MLAAVLQMMCGADVDPSVGVRGRECRECVYCGEVVFCRRTDVLLDLCVRVDETSCCRGVSA